MHDTIAPPQLDGFGRTVKNVQVKFNDAERGKRLRALHPFRCFSALLLYLLKHIQEFEEGPETLQEVTGEGSPIGSSVK